MADKKKEKEKLMEQVFGKNAPNRKLTDEDLRILVSNPLSGEDLSPEWKSIQENSKKLQQQTQNILDQFSEADFENLKSELRKDFGDVMPAEQQESLTIISEQKPLNAKYEAIETELNKNILSQESYLHTLITAFRRPTVMGVQPSGLKNAVLIWGQAYTGRHSSVELLAKGLVKNQLLNNENISTIDLSQYSGKESETILMQDLYTAANASQIILFDHIESIAASFLPNIVEIVTEGKLTMSKRYTLNNRQLVETSTSLVKDTVKTISFKGKYLVFVTTLKPSKLLEIVGVRFLNSMGDVLQTKDIVKDDIPAIYQQKAVYFFKKCNDNLKIKVKCDVSVQEYVTENFVDSENASYVINFFDRCYEAVSEYKLHNLSEDITELTISARDSQIYVADTLLTELLPKVLGDAREEVRKELDELVGLVEIKKYVLSLEDFYEAQKLRELQGLKTTEVSKHMIFTGNPGTGKTTVARLIAKFLKAIGVLSNGQLIEVSRNDLVGKYMGHTAPQTMQVIKSAMGGILFIDEAYSLYRGTNDSFGLEAIDTLVKAMEDNRDDLIVILAGYTREMKEFLNSNSGLASRFPNQIEFPDYTAEELYDITVIQAKSKGYKLADEIKGPLTEYFAKVQAHDSVRSGNGRLARNIVEEAIIRQSKRIVNEKDANLNLLMLCDLDLEGK